ncbi:glycosyltransferase family 2 protein [Gammaproteobacteria bacterium]|nr:glycosyltransferase family 2 protein [Gammaproteobacteria bacterium]
MKLIVQIPCYNEEETLPQTIQDIPREIEGIDEIELLIVDDGSTDQTIKVAKDLGVDHIIRNKNNMGLARAFRIGLEACLKAGADIIVNTDGDNQYCGQDIPKLIQPILSGRVDIVIGDRQISTVSHLSTTTKALHWLGSGLVRKLAGVWVPDAVSGFRAFSSSAAVQLNIVSPFSYTIETIIQAAKKGIAISSVSIRTNPKTRESRLFKSTPMFIGQSVLTMARMYTMYQSLRVFFLIGTTLSIVGLIPIIMFIFYYFTEGGAGHIQSLVLGSVVLLMGFITFLVGMLADLISSNRQLVESTLERIKKLELDESTRQPNDEE